MPRINDSDEQSKSNGSLVFSEIVDCPACSSAFDGVWVDNSITVEDIVEPPMATQICPECKHVFEAELTGWMNYGDA